MELVKNIFFNTDKLIENSIVKISYTGELFQNNANSVFVHYGFGNNWDNLTEKEMVKTELGFQAEIKLIGTEPLNLCFRTDSNEWDNNNNQNYSFNIEPVTLALALVDQSSLKYPRKLRKTYIWSKKVKLAIYKIIRFVPKIVSGNYFRKTTNEEQ